MCITYGTHILKRHSPELPTFSRCRDKGRPSPFRETLLEETPYYKKVSAELRKRRTKILYGFRDKGRARG